MLRKLRSFNALLVIGLTATATAFAAPGEEASKAKELINPVPYSEESAQSGRKHYLRHCQICHGYDGRALENIDFEAADLTAPSTWRYGTSDGELFVNTRDGAGEEMPPFENQLREEEIWQLVNYIRSIGPVALRGSASSNTESQTATEGDDGRAQE